MFKQVSLLAFLVALPFAATADTSHVSPRSAPAATARRDLAPADAYFGPFGMSPLSIRSTIGFLGRQYHYRTLSDHDVVHKALDAEFALRKWRTAYPADPWLAPTFFHLEQLYQAVQTDEARRHAAALLKDIVRLYPTTKEAHLSRARLASGFPPLVAETPLVASPAPSAAPQTAAGTADASSAPAAASASAAAPSATPAAAPSATSAAASSATPAPSAMPPASATPAASASASASGAAPPHG